MVRLEGGTFTMGSDGPEVGKADGESPAREVNLDPFEIDEHAVTNRQFLEFVEDTGYETDAEHYGWSYVFAGLIRQQRLRHRPHPQHPWWLGVPGASWRQPRGPRSDIRDIMDHPVTHISWNDATEYAEWAGKQLPTEAQWEYAARGGLEGRLYPWGDELLPHGEHRCNIWQGRFPANNVGADGYIATAPAKSFPPNGYGLYNMTGNVWEWCTDWWSTDFTAQPMPANPHGPNTGKEKVIRGGSYLCHHSYCNRYRNSARTKNTPDTSTGNIGFRCARHLPLTPHD